jgi:hypothetical protein
MPRRAKCDDDLQIEDLKSQERLDAVALATDVSNSVKRTQSKHETRLWRYRA